MLAELGSDRSGHLGSMSSLIFMAYGNCLWTCTLFVARHIDV